MRTSIALVSILALSFAATSLSTRGSVSEEHYPSRPVKMIVPYPAGGPMDVVARLIAGKLSRSLDASFYVENVPGASGTLGAHDAAAAPGDGYTLLWVNPDFIVQPLIKQDVPYDAFRGFTAVSWVASAPEAIMVHPSVPAKTISELMAVIKANPGKYSYATPGFGTPSHLAGERLFNLTYHLDVTHVSFQGAAPAVTSTITGHTQILFVTIGAVGPNLKDGSLRAIAVESPKRWPAFPDVPTLAESGLVGYDAEFILGLMAPAGTPKSIVNLAMSDVSEQVADEVGRLIDVSAATHIVDLGGASGGVIAALLEKNPALHGTILELPHVVPQARSVLDRRDLTSRCRVVEGDFFEAVPEADCYILKHIIHDWDDERSVRILSNYARSLRTSGRVFVIERLLLEDDASSDAALADLNMLVLLPGRKRTVKQYGKLLRAAGLSLDRVCATNSALHIIEASESTPVGASNSAHGHRASE